jgi:hypothetical protein
MHPANIRPLPIVYMEPTFDTPAHTRAEDRLPWQPKTIELVEVEPPPRRNPGSALPSSSSGYGSSSSASSSAVSSEETSDGAEEGYCSSDDDDNANNDATQRPGGAPEHLRIAAWRRNTFPGSTSISAGKRICSRVAVCSLKLTHFGRAGAIRPRLATASHDGLWASNTCRRGEPSSPDLIISGPSLLTVGVRQQGLPPPSGACVRHALPHVCCSACDECFATLQQYRAHGMSEACRDAVSYGLESPPASGRRHPELPA